MTVAIALGIAVVALACGNLYNAYALDRLWNHVTKIATSQQAFNDRVCEHQRLSLEWMCLRSGIDPKALDAGKSPTP